jgi:phage-related protein (TIGR01555 family)
MPVENKAASLRLELAKLGNIEPREATGIVVPKSKARLDSWANENTGFGFQHATNNSQYFRVAKKLEAELSSLYESDWATRKGCDMPASDMVRKGISFLHNDDDENSQETVEQLEDILINEWSWAKLETEAIKFQRLSGGCATFYNFGGTEEDQRDPIEESQIKEIRSIRNFPSWLAVPLSWYTEFDHPKLGQPEHYQLLFRDPSTSRTVVVHESRLHIMQGETVSPSTRAQNRGWNDSPIQSIYNALRNFGVASSAVSGILQDFNWFSLGIEGLADKVQHQDDDSILERIYLARQKLHSGNLSLYDSGSESMERHGTPVNGLERLWDRTAEEMCAAWSIPRGMFLTAKEGSLGGSSAETDKARYYDIIGSQQETHSRPWKNDFIHYVSLVNGINDSDIKYIFNPIQSKTDKERYEERKFVAETDKLYYDIQALSSKEIAESRFSKPEVDLETMNLDFEERNAQEKLEEFNQENEDKIQELDIQGKEIDNKNKKNGEQIPDEPKKTEKKDSALPVIEVKPIINVAAPIIPEFPKPVDLTKLIESMNTKLDQVAAKKEDTVIKFEE